MTLDCFARLGSDVISLVVSFLSLGDDVISCLRCSRWIRHWVLVALPLHRSQYDVIVWAVRAGYPRVLDGVLKLAGVDPSMFNNIAVRIASTSDAYLDNLRLLLDDKRVDPTASCNGPIRRASEYGLARIVETLLDDGRPDPSAVDSAALRSACKNGHVDTVRLLLADGRASPSADGNAALLSASSKGHLQIVGMLLNDPRVNPGYFGNVAVLNATMHNHADVVLRLLADPRVHDVVDEGYLLRRACHHGVIGVVQWLLRDRSHRDLNYQAALLAARKAGQNDIVQMLVNGGHVSPPPDLDVNLKRRRCPCHRCMAMQMRRSDAPDALPVFTGIDDHMMPSLPGRKCRFM
ncbi:Ankyrin repeat domain-containing protein [Plasmodiophora brassicae]